MNKRNITTACLLGFIITLSSCTDSKTKLSTEIASVQEAEIQNGETKAKLAELQETFVNEYPNDSMSQMYLENIAMYNQLTNHDDKAIDLSKRYLNTYPGSDNASTMILGIAKAFAHKGESDSAIHYFEEAQNQGQIPISDLRVLAEVLRNQVNNEEFSNRDQSLMKFAGIVESIQGPDAAIVQYKRLYTEFSESKYAPYGMMKHEGILEAKGDIKGATVLLNQIISDYPESTFATDAKSMLENDLLGKSAEEQLEILLNKNSVQ